ncbi:MAG TPA: DNA repair helicase XPB [Planctomycetota bacterium]|nr:DNA repair helicase XPB [Planctomycetota bacterium]
MNLVVARDRPLIVQSDRTVLLLVDHPRFEEAREALARFAELEKSPEHLHTYRVTPISVWSAAALGTPFAAIRESLTGWSQYPVPKGLLAEVEDWHGRWGRLRLEREGGRLLLRADREETLRAVASLDSVEPHLREAYDGSARLVDEGARGALKQALVRLGWPVEDLAGYLDGDPLPVGMRSTTRSGAPFAMRPYQADAIEAFHAGGSVRGGSGVVVLPCGAGKTVVGMGVLAAVGTHALVLTTNTVAVRQWREELLDKTTLLPEQIGEFTGASKSIRPVTLSTYQMITYRSRKTDDFPHFRIFGERNWGLVVYDEVHLLPAPVFRITADLQARRRLGLTATLVREDGREDEVFGLIGPKRFDVPWRALERQGFIATARCVEVRVPLEAALRDRYLLAPARERFRIASENPAKEALVAKLLALHEGDLVLVLGQYLDQLRGYAARLAAPLITGGTPVAERQRLYEEFRRGRIRLLLLSRVGNFAIDLPDANVAIEISGTFGSRQEEAQRLGRILRPKEGGRLAHFYALVTEDSRDQDFAEKRQRFLAEQGYAYEIRGVRAIERRLRRPDPPRRDPAEGETR